jgi:hypothetical protein
MEAGMASLYKKPVILNDPKTDKPVKTKSRKWWGRFKDEHGVEHRFPLAAEQESPPAFISMLNVASDRRHNQYPLTPDNAPYIRRRKCCLRFLIRQADDGVFY